MPKPKPAPLALAPTQALDAPYTMRQRRGALKQFYLDGEMQAWTPEQAAKFLCTVEPAVQAAQAVLIAAAKAEGGLYYFEQCIDGQPITGLYVDERGTSKETVNAERAAPLFGMYLRNQTPERQDELLLHIWRALNPNQKNKLCLQSENSASAGKKKSEPLLLDFFKWAQKHHNEDGELLALHEGKTSWAIRQSPPNSSIVADAQPEEDEEDGE